MLRGAGPQRRIRHLELLLSLSGVASRVLSAGDVLIGVRRPDTGAMTETESLIVEVRQLRADVARLHAAHTAVHIRHGWMRLLLKDLSTNPYTQYKVHMWGAIYWLINFPLICCLFFFTPTLWLKLGIFITLIYSIYANLATDYGAMSAAEAAFGEPQPPPIPLEPPPPLTPR